MRTDLHIDHLLLRYDADLMAADRLEAIVQRALELAAARVDAPLPARGMGDDAVTIDFSVAGDGAIAELLADALLLKLEQGG